MLGSVQDKQQTHSEREGHIVLYMQVFIDVHVGVCGLYNNSNNYITSIIILSYRYNATLSTEYADFYACLHQRLSRNLSK